MELPLHLGLDDLQGAMEDLQDVLHQPKKWDTVEFVELWALFFRLFLEALISKILGLKVDLIHEHRSQQS